jgi:hypothetical protein
MEQMHLDQSSLLPECFKISTFIHSFKAIRLKNKLLNSKLEIDHNKLNGDTAQDSANEINTFNADFLTKQTVNEQSEQINEYN